MDLLRRGTLSERLGGWRVGLGMTRIPFLLASLLIAVPAFAQTTVTPKPAVPAPQVDPGIEAKPQTGVVHPPSTDPGMTVAPPRPGAEKVIPPPSPAPK